MDISHRLFIVNTAMTENQKFLQQKLILGILQIYQIKHKHNFNLRSERKEVTSFPFKTGSHKV